MSMRSHAPAPSSIAARDDERGDDNLSLGVRPNIPVNSPNSVKAWEITKRSKDPQEKKKGSDQIMRNFCTSSSIARGKERKVAPLGQSMW